MAKEKVERNKKIINYREKGYSFRALGRLFKISHPRVITILKRYEKIGLSVDKRYKGRGAKSPKTKKEKSVKNL